jgi:hypothetical protein
MAAIFMPYAVTLALLRTLNRRLPSYLGLGLTRFYGPIRV